MRLRILSRLFSKALTVCLAGAAMLAAAVPAAAQQYVELESFEVTPFVGYRFGGMFEVLPDSAVPVEATLKESQSYGFSAGVRFDHLSVVEFRWTKQKTALQFDAPFRPLGQALGDVTLNQFHADFTREFIIPEVKGLRSYLSGSVGATHLAASPDSFTRFSFDFGAGLKQFLGSKLAIRAEARWLPIWLDPEVSGFGCNSVTGGCLLLLDGKMVQQFEMSIGPVLIF